LSDQVNPIILASASISRQRLLQRLGLPFQAIAADIDESALPGEQTAAQVQRLAMTKAHKISQQHPSALVIGADQLLVLANGQALGKPLTREGAEQQLAAMSGQSLHSMVGVALIRQQHPWQQVWLNRAHITMRPYQSTTIRHYLDQVNSLHCAGSIAYEHLGHLLVERIDSDDPDQIYGLPMLSLTTALFSAGISPALFCTAATQ